MLETEEYTLFHLAAYLLENEKYKILYMNQDTNELWLVKIIKNKSTIIRLSQGGFYWTNQLKLDIASVFKKTEFIRSTIQTKDVEIFNVYISAKEPVDDWEALKQPLLAKQNKLLKMNVFYLSDAEKLAVETKRLFEQMNIDKIGPKEPLSEQEKVNFVTTYKASLHNKLKLRQEREQEKIRTYSKTRINYLFVSLQIIFFFLFNIIGFTFLEPFYQLMIFNKELILTGEWWRLISSLFIHQNVIHIVLTIVPLYYLGLLIERNYGAWRYIVLFFIAGIGGNITNIAFGNNLVMNGSTAIVFGFLGALLILSFYFQRLYLETIGKNIMLIFLILIVLAIFFPELAVLPFIGSFISGFIIANVVYLPKRKAILLQISSGILLILSFFVIFVLGL